MTDQEVLDAAEDVRGDSRWEGYYASNNTALWDELTTRYGKVDARLVWVEACKGAA